MPIGRILLKSISESKKLAGLKTDGARLLYSWIIPHVDIQGCFSGDPIIIKGKIFTRLDKSLEEIQEYIDDMIDVGLIKIIKHNGEKYIFLHDFAKKQPKLNPEREAKPLLTPDLLTSNSRPTHPLSKVKESKVKESLSKDEVNSEVSNETKEELKKAVDLLTSKMIPNYNKKVFL